ncbi:isopentenyl-diphosphate delta-isomerase [Nitzschia inconspicua]|uniref:Isopentenyl-diphosphate delta-isomerase n=1 Tax=Nitzschia inconspicua TaxID=303405 RepID=A0A9K3PW15_9STRA|nr:isopentenyl-diphosphate delta-isomerase [Nitzschia inconspicua]
MMTPRRLVSVSTAAGTTGIFQKRLYHGIVCAVVSCLIPYETYERPSLHVYGFSTHATTRTRTTPFSNLGLPSRPVSSSMFNGIINNNSNQWHTSRSFMYNTNLHPSSRIATRLFSSSITSSSSFTAYGENMNQNDMMESDKLILVDENDNVVRAGDPKLCSKKAGHTFDVQTPRGILHRAFSLFCFNQDNQLLLTQRADSKITFPSVWTNTACSHPLQDMALDEVDDFSEAYPRLPGIKRAAVRKAQHELGLDLRQHVDAMQFVSRFHYWAADVQTHGLDTPWGEHEVDYILFVKLPQEVLSSVSLNPEEVSNVRYVFMDELKDMMYHRPDLTWSPWFVGIMERGGFDWWDDLDATLKGTNTNTDIQFFDPLPDHVASYNLDTHTRTTGVLSQSAAEKLASTEPKNWVRIT